MLSINRFTFWVEWVGCCFSKIFVSVVTLITHIAHLGVQYSCFCDVKVAL